MGAVSGPRFPESASPVLGDIMTGIVSPVSLGLRASAAPKVAARQMERRKCCICLIFCHRKYIAKQRKGQDLLSK